MAHELTTERMNVRGYHGAGKHRVKDSILLIIVFAIGLLGTCYILHFALSEKSGTGYYYDNSESVDSESIYFTASR